MDELDVKRQDRYMKDNEYLIYDILNMIKNKDKIVREEFSVTDLKSIYRLEKIIKEMYSDRTFLFTDWSDYYTVLNINEADNFLNVLHELITDVIGYDYTVEIEKLSMPRSLSFRVNEDSEEKYFLVGWDGGTITV